MTSTKLFELQNLILNLIGLKVKNNITISTNYRSNKMINIIHNFSFGIFS